MEGQVRSGQVRSASLVVLERTMTKSASGSFGGRGLGRIGRWTYLESLGTELLGHRGHLLVVAAGRASLTRHVGHEDNLALELVEGHVVAVDVLGAEVVERFGGGHGNGGGATDGAGGGHSAGAKLGLNDRGASGERGDGLHHTGVERSGGVAEIKFDATCSVSRAGQSGSLHFLQASRTAGGATGVTWVRKDAVGSSRIDV